MGEGYEGVSKDGICVYSNELGFV